MSIKEKIENSRPKDKELIDLPDLLGALPAAGKEDVLLKEGMVSGVEGAAAPRISGKTPVLVVSTITTGVTDRSFEVAAATLIKPACPCVGFVNFVTVKVWVIAAANVPDRNFTVSTELVNEALHEAAVGEMTAQALSEANAIPAPDSVMTIPPLFDPDAIAELGVNENVAVVCAAFMAEERVIASGDKVNSETNVNPDP